MPVVVVVVDLAAGVIVAVADVGANDEAGKEVGREAGREVSRAGVGSSPPKKSRRQ